MHIDPWILTFSAATVLVTIWMGFWSAKKSKTASDFFVAGRSVSVGWNASAISGEYLSAASFMGVAGMVMSSGYDALWYPVCYACGYLFLLLFIAGPLRRFGAYTIPDFAEGRFDSPLFRKIAVVFVLFIGFFYTMPQMKGAGTTLSYIFQDLDFRGTALAFLAPHEKGEALKGLHYGVGVFLVGAVITLNVALGGMKGITLVQAFQYWAKMFAISVPIFVLMAVYGHYGRQVGGNGVPKNKAEANYFAWNEEDEEAKSKPGAAKFEFKGSFIEQPEMRLGTLLLHLGMFSEKNLFVERNDTMLALLQKPVLVETGRLSNERFLEMARRVATTNGVFIVAENKQTMWFAVDPNNALSESGLMRIPIPSQAPKDSSWIHPFGPLTTKAAKSAAVYEATNTLLSIPPTHVYRMKIPKKQFGSLEGKTVRQVFDAYETFTHLARYSARLPGELRKEDLDLTIKPLEGKVFPNLDQESVEETKAAFEKAFEAAGITLVGTEKSLFRAVRSNELAEFKVAYWNDLARQRLDCYGRPLSLLYTYSLIIALVCGTAGLPHILVRFYTNPDGVAAKRTTMWVMILIGVFYLFPPVFGVMGRNLMPSLYEGAGAKGTDKVVLELPRLLNNEDGKTGKRENGNEAARSQGSSSRLPVFSSSTPPANSRPRFPWGSVLSGITCAGAFAAFMSTFSGLLVSMTGALAHDVYGRIFRPKSTAEQRLRMFKLCTVIVGGGAMLLGFLVESFEINKMVGWAFAIAATSYFPLLFLSTWWRGITMKGAATGMLAGGTLSLVAIASTMFADQAAWATGLKDYYAAHPLLRILAEQPAIWALPLAMSLMFVLSKLTAKEVPADIRMKMLVLHAPEKLGLKQEYIQEHQQGH